jgi:hypothetical protein
MATAYARAIPDAADSHRAAVRARAMLRIGRELRYLVESGRVDKARRAAASLPADDEWKRALAPPIVRVGPRTDESPIARNAAWLAEHRHRFAGMWVALRDGNLVASDQSRLALQRAIGALANTAGILMAKVPA